MDILNYWQLREKPFESTRNSKFFFPSQNHSEALDRLLYVIRDGNMNIGILTGEIGCGKTITKTALEHQLLNENFQVVSIENSCFPFHPTLIEILSQLKNIKVDMKENDEYTAMNMLKELLVKIVIEKKRHLVILMDEAQQLKNETLDKIKNLTNICSEVENYLTIVLIGQPELRGRIKSLPQFDQRVSLRYHLKHLPDEEIKDYIYHRLRVAGCDNKAVFTKAAIDLICEATNGIPREINRICKLSLDTAFAFNENNISKTIVNSIVKDINFHGNASEHLDKTDKSFYQCSESDVLFRPENSKEEGYANLINSDSGKDLVEDEILPQDHPEDNEQVAKPQLENLDDEEYGNILSSAEFKDLVMEESSVQDVSLENDKVETPESKNYKSRQYDSIVSSDLIKDLSANTTSSYDNALDNDSVSKSQPETHSENQNRDISNSNLSKILIVDESSPQDNPLYQDLIAKGYAVTTRTKNFEINKKNIQQFNLVIVIVNIKNNADEQLLHHLSQLKKSVNVPILITINPSSTEGNERMYRLVVIRNSKIVIFPINSKELNQNIAGLLERN